MDIEGWPSETVSVVLYSSIFQVLNFEEFRELRVGVIGFGIIRVQFRRLRVVVIWVFAGYNSVFGVNFLVVMNPGMVTTFE